MGTLTARLFYLQIINGSQASALAAKNRTVLESIPAPRGLIYDRNGRALVTNIPTFAVKLRPTDLPVERRPEVVQRLAAMLEIDPAEINTSIDSNPGSAFDLVRIAEDIDADTARLIQESRTSCQASMSSSRRDASTPMDRCSPRSSGTRVRSRRHSSPRSRSAAICPTTWSARPASNRRTRPSCAASTASRPSSATPAGRRPRSCERTRRSSRANSLTLTIDTKVQQEAQKALKWAMKSIGLKRGVVIAMNPQTGEVLAMVSLPTYNNNLFARGSAPRPSRPWPRTRTCRCSTTPRWPTTRRDRRTSS